MIGAGRLPDLGPDGYRGNHADMAQARVMTGTHRQPSLVAHLDEKGEW
jgi:hypothetical protein